MWHHDTAREMQQKLAAIQDAVAAHCEAFPPDGRELLTLQGLVLDEAERRAALIELAGREDELTNGWKKFVESEVLPRVATAPPPDVSEVGQLTKQAARKGFAGLSPIQILLVVLVVLICTGAPVAELHLPPELQELTSNEPGYIALAIVITGAIVKGNRKS